MSFLSKIRKLKIILGRSICQPQSCTLPGFYASTPSPKNPPPDYDPQRWEHDFDEVPLVPPKVFVEPNNPSIMGLNEEISKCGKYPCIEYFKFHKFSYYDFYEPLLCLYQPQPIGGGGGSTTDSPPFDDCSFDESESERTSTQDNECAEKSLMVILESFSPKLEHSFEDGLCPEVLTLKPQIN